MLQYKHHVKIIFYPFFKLTHVFNFPTSTFFPINLSGNYMSIKFVPFSHKLNLWNTKSSDGHYFCWSILIMSSFLIYYKESGCALLLQCKRLRSRFFFSIFKQRWMNIVLKCIQASESILVESSISYLEKIHGFFFILEFWSFFRWKKGMEFFESFGFWQMKIEKSFPSNKLHSMIDWFFQIFWECFTIN